MTIGLSNYGELQTMLGQYLVRESITADIKTLIGFAETRINTDLRVRFMEATENVPIESGVRESALPEGYLQAKAVYIDSTKAQLKPKNLKPYWSLWANKTPAEPEVYATEKDSFLWGPVPDTGYTAVCHYYKAIDPLINDADTNGLFELSPTTYIYASLVETEVYLGNDPRLATWTAMYEDRIAALQSADGRDRNSGDTPDPRVEAQRT